MVLRPIRFGSYGDKIWFFRPEDLAALPHRPNAYPTNMKKVLSSDLHPVFSAGWCKLPHIVHPDKSQIIDSEPMQYTLYIIRASITDVVLIRNSLRKTMLKKKGSSDIWNDGKYAFISQASGGRYNERSEWSITLYTVT